VGAGGWATGADTDGTDADADRSAGGRWLAAQIAAPAATVLITAVHVRSVSGTVRAYRERTRVAHAPAPLRRWPR